MRMPRQPSQHSGNDRSTWSFMDARPAPQGMYDPRDEHDACGVDFVATLTGEASHTLVEQALTVLRNLEHRGATGSEPDSGDGAGILSQVPDAFFREVAGFELPEAGGDRKSTRLNSSHVKTSYAVFCLKKNQENNIFMSATNIHTRDIPFPYTTLFRSGVPHPGRAGPHRSAQPRTPRRHRIRAGLRRRRGNPLPGARRLLPRGGRIRTARGGR